MTPETVLAALLALPPWHGDVDRGADARELDLAPVASAIAQATDDRGLVAALVAQAFHETRLASPVLHGRCDSMPKGEDCDRGKARGAWQVWRVACPEAYEHPDGSHESIRLEARCMARVLTGGRVRCKSWVGAFAATTGGAVCSGPRWEARERTRQGVLGTLARLGG